MVAVTSVTNVEKSVRENPGKGGIGAPGSKIKNMRSILDLDQVGGNYFEDKNKGDLQSFVFQAQECIYIRQYPVILDRKSVV